MYIEHPEVQKIQQVIQFDLKKQKTIWNSSACIKSFFEQVLNSSRCFRCFNQEKRSTQYSLTF